MQKTEVRKQKSEKDSRQYAVRSKQKNTNYLLPTAYCLLLTAYCLLAGYTFANPIDSAQLPPSTYPPQALITPQKLKIGCILPLSGEGADIGQKVLEGIQLAFNTFNFPDEETGYSWQLVIRDSAGETSVLNLLESLAKDEDMVVIIGPLFSKAVVASAKVADKYMIPIFSPTAASKYISGISPYVFRNSLTNKMQGKAIADYSINLLNLRRFAVLYQRDSYGIQLKNAFEDEIMSFGGEVIFSEPFDPDQSDFAPQITAIGGIKDSDLKKLLESGELRPELGYEAIFISGSAGSAGLILPELAYYNISDVTILGGNSLNSPDLVKMGGKYAEGVIFVDGFLPFSDNPVVKEFVERYRIFYNREPDIYSANSYDATRIIMEILKNGAKSREDIRNGLINIRDYNGVSGITTIYQAGDSEKSLYFLTVKNGKIIEYIED